RKCRIIRSSKSRNAVAPRPATTPTSGLQTATRPAPGVAQRPASRFSPRDSQPGPPRCPSAESGPAMKPRPPCCRPSLSREEIWEGVDRPTLDPVLAFEIGQVVEVVLGCARFGSRPFLEPGMPRHQAANHAEVLLHVRGHPQLAPRQERALDVGNQRLRKD